MTKDEEKEAYLNELGIEVLRFEDKEVLGDIDNVMAVLLDYIEKRGIIYSTFPLSKEGRGCVMVGHYNPQYHNMFLLTNYDDR